MTYYLYFQIKSVLLVYIFEVLAVQKIRFFEIKFFDQLN